jgi:MtrB/PioB family decaheme-associated outer membrane protein
MAMMKRKQLAAVINAALLAGLLAGTAQAQDDAAVELPDFSKWQCRFCTEYDMWYGEGLFGIGWVSDESLRFGSYRGLEDDGAYAAIDGEAHLVRLNGRYADIYARNLGLDSRQLEARGGVMGKYEVRFGWSELPFYRGYDASTPFSGQGTGNLTLPADWVRARNTAGMTGLQNALVPAELGLQRETLDLGLSMRLASAWSFDVDAQRQEKTGTRPFGGGGIYFNDASILPAPVDFSTDIVDLGVNWTGKKASARLGFMGSWFDNGTQSVTWDNPFTSGPGTDRFRAALEPSNDYYQFNLSGVYNITQGINVSGRAAMGEGTQDEAFLPYSINPDFEGIPLPRASLGGQVDTSTYNLGGKLYARLSSKLSLTARYKYDERDNTTPVSLYSPVISDFIQLEDRFNKPYSFERTQYSLDARYRLTRGVRVSAGGKYQELDRTLQVVENQDETTAWAEVDLTPMARTQLRLKIEGSERDVNEYRANESRPGPVDNPLFRKYNQADRDRTRVILDANVMPTDRLSVNLNAYTAIDDYNNSVLGLQDSDVESYTLNLSYAAGDKLSLYAFYTREEIESNLNGASGTRERDRWFADTVDNIETFGLGGTMQFDDRGSLSLDWVSADTKGDIQVRSELSDDPFPTLSTKLNNLRLSFKQTLTENWGYRMMVEYEQYDASDWAIDGFGVDGLGSVLWSGVTSPEYDIWNLRLQATYRFQ